MRLALMITVTLAISLKASAEISWSPDLRTAHDEAQRQQKLLLVHFESDNCVWCDRLEAGAFRSPEVAQAVGQSFVAVKINASKNPQLAEYFKVSRFPSDVVVDTSGAVHAHGVSPQEADKYVAMLQQAALKGLPSAPANTQIAQAPQVASAAPAETISAPTLDTEYALPPQVGASSVETRPEFQLPTQVAAMPVQGQAASVRTSGPSDTQANNQGPANITENDFINRPAANVVENTELTAESANLPPLAIDGFCAVSILEDQQWVAGDKRFGAIHLGKLYLFADKDRQQKFLADPIRYTPALGGLDVVEFLENRTQTEGIREYGLHHRGQLYFFSSEQTLKTFFRSPDSYSVKAQEIMRQATSESRTLR